MIVLEGYDLAVLGPAFVWHGGEQIETLVYDAEGIRKILMDRDGMDEQEAREFIEYNIERLNLGPGTPILVWPEDYYEHPH